MPFSRNRCQSPPTFKPTSATPARRLAALLLAAIPLALASASAIGDAKLNIKSAIDNCGTDYVNNAMATLKWNTDGSSKGWLNMNQTESPALRQWYSDQANQSQGGYLTPGAIANINDYYANVMNRSAIQNSAGTKPGFWMASIDNQTLMSPQVLYTIKALGSDVVVMRVHESPTRVLNYQLYANAQTTTATPKTLNIGYPTLYQKVKDGTITADANKQHVVLGYDFATKAVKTPVAGDSASVCEASTQLEGLFAQFDVLNGTIDESNMNMLARGEYVVDPSVATNPPPLRELNPCYNSTAPECANKCTKQYLDDVFRINYANGSAAYKSTIKAQGDVNQTLAPGAAAGTPPAISGLAYDGTIYSPGYEMFMSEFAPTLSDANKYPNSKYSHGANWQCKYRAGLRSKFLEDSKNHFAFFNLLEPGSILNLDQNRCIGGADPISSTAWRQRQEELLQYAHGGLVEYFGGRDVGNNTFPCLDALKAQGVTIPSSDDVCTADFCKRKFSAMLEQLSMWRRNPEKAFLVAGRAPKTFNSYADEYNWQEYLYGVYLLGSGPNTAFKPISTFRLPLANGEGRTDGLQVFDFQLLDLGNPNNTFAINKDAASGIYWRKFAAGFVMVYPHDATTGNGSIANVKTKAPSGLDWSDVPATLTKGQAVIVTGAPRKSQVGRIIDFQNGNAQALFNTYSDTDVIVPAANSLRIKETAPDPVTGLDQAYLTDLLLNIVKYRSHRGTIKLDFTLNGAPRGGAEYGKIVLVAEVDDERTVNLDKRRQNVVFELYMGPRPASLPEMSVANRPLYRKNTSTSDTAEDVLITRISASQSQSSGLPTVTPGSTVTFTLSPQSNLDNGGHGHLKFRRWDMVRFYGDYSLRKVQIGEDANLSEYPQGLMGFETPAGGSTTGQARVSAKKSLTR